MKTSILMGIFLASCLIYSGCFAEEQVKASGDKVWGDTQKKWTYLEGNVRITQGTNQITTTKAEINLDQKLLYLTGDVGLVHAEVKITAARLDYDLRKKTGTFKEQVGLERLKVTDLQGLTTKEPFKLSCDELYFETESNNFNAKGKVRIEAADFTGSSDLLDYQDQRQELYLRGNAYLKRPAGDEIRGEEILINLKDKGFLVKRQVTLEFKVDDEPKPGEADPSLEKTKTQ